MVEARRTEPPPHATLAGPCLVARLPHPVAVGALADVKIFTRYSTKEAMDRLTATRTRVRGRALSSGIEFGSIVWSRERAQSVAVGTREPWADVGTGRLCIGGQASWEGRGRGLA